MKIILATAAILLFLAAPALAQFGYGVNPNPGSSLIVTPQGTTFINQYPGGGMAISPRGTSVWFNTGMSPAIFSRPDTLLPYYAPRPYYPRYWYGW